MLESLSDISRTNQIKLTQTHEDITQTYQEIAEKLYQYLFTMNVGIETFSANDLDLSKYESSSLNRYQQRHRAIKLEIKKRLAQYGANYKYADIHYFLSYSNGKNEVFFLSPNKTHSGWKQLFCDKWNTSNRERIFNLIFKFYLLSNQLPNIDTLTGFEELVMVHSKNPVKSENTSDSSNSEDILVVWGQNIFINFNYHNVLTTTLTRKKRLFLPKKDEFSTFDGEDMGELLVYKKKNYYFNRDLDSRSKNSIKFMQFDKDVEKFKKTQLYHYQNLMTKLESFLMSCGIAYQPLNFQADHYLEDSFIKDIKIPIEKLEIINNSGIDLTDFDKKFLVSFLTRQGISEVSFYKLGKTISSYELISRKDERSRIKACWKVQEIVPWAEIQLDQTKNYLVLNKILDEDTESSMAYKGDDGLWYATTEIDKKQVIDFYSTLKQNSSFLNTGIFYSVQGLNVMDFKAIGNQGKETETIDNDNVSLWSVLNYDKEKIDGNALQQAVQSFTNGQILGIEESISCYLIEQQDNNLWQEFFNKYKLKISSEFEKVLIELQIKNWIRKSLLDPNTALHITMQSFTEKQFFAIYVRRPKDKEAKAVAVEFLYQEGYIYIKNVMRDVKEIEKRFPILRKLKSKPNVLKNDQQYFVDDKDKIYISCYTDDYFTPTLIGSTDIMQKLEGSTLEINRKGGNLLPLVLHYNNEVKQIQLKNSICLDLKNETFIQYFIPPAQALQASIKRGFRVYHLFGESYANTQTEFAKKYIPTNTLIEHPIVLLHFSTRTQNILKISENSQSSLLQKVAKVFIEN